jgi:hypothetical protein
MLIQASTLPPPRDSRRLAISAHSDPLDISRQAHAFPRLRSARLALVAVLLVTCPFFCARAQSRLVNARQLSAKLTWNDVLRLRSARDYFALRDRLAIDQDPTSAPARFARALVQNAFNMPAASNAIIEELLATATLPDSLATQLRRVQMANDMRLFEYAAGSAVADTMLNNSRWLDSATVRDIQNTQRMFRALAATPPQKAEIRGSTRLKLEHGQVPVWINGSMRYYSFDTGANLSTLMRSEASALGLRILPAGIDVGSSTDRRVTADLAVADKLSIGAIQYQHVVFLVMDDSLLTFPGGYRIHGLIGFPVIEQMGEVQFSRDGEFIVPDASSRRLQHNLILDELTPLVRVRWSGSTLLCRLDTGAGTTRFYEPFYRRFQTRIDSTARRGTRRIGGAGGISEIPVRVLPSTRLSLGDTVATLDSVDVIPQSIAPTSENYLDCNIGKDILQQFSRYVLDFRDMTFLLR